MYSYYFLSSVFKSESWHDYHLSVHVQLIGRSFWLYADEIAIEVLHQGTCKCQYVNLLFFFFFFPRRDALDFIEGKLGTPCLGADQGSRFLSPDVFQFSNSHSISPSLFHPDCQSFFALMITLIFKPLKVSFSRE